METQRVRIPDPQVETPPAGTRRHSLGETQPTYRRDDPLSHFQPIALGRKRPSKLWRFWIALAVLAFSYLFFPARTNILILGIDRAPAESAVGRSDTNILLSFAIPFGKAKALSIPRDLWVAIPGYGENRINTAHFFGEAAQEGQGPTLAVATVERNFGIGVDYYLRIQLEKFPAVIDSLGGLDINLPYKMGGLKKGAHHLNGEQALAFVRDRSGADDFTRMRQNQVLLLALVKNLLNPLKWVRLPVFLITVADVVDTNLPVWQLPRLGAATLIGMARGIEFHVIDRKMVTGWITTEGAQVLLPNWNLILPFVHEIMR